MGHKTSPCTATFNDLLCLNVGFVVDKAALGQVFSECFGFPCQIIPQKFTIIIINLGWHNRPIGGRSAECTQLDSTLTIPITKKKKSS
jgi:hypothetical protein